MKRHILFVLLTLIISFPLQAQPKGKPNLKPYKALKKKAKSGPKAGIAYAEVAAGKFHTPNEQKDYKKALKYYDKYVKGADKKLPEGKAGEMLLFRMYFTGGFGIDPDQKKALHYLSILDKHHNLERIYEYKENLYLVDIFNVQQEAGLGNADAQIRMARYLLEYEMHFTKAREWLQKASRKNRQDANYLKARWNLLRSRKALDAPKEWSGTLVQELLRISAKYLPISDMARLEYIYLSTLDGQNPSEDEMQRALQPILAENYPHKERQIKALALLGKVQKGKKRIATLRRILELAPNFDSAELKFVQKALSEIREVESKLKTLEGLHQLLTEREDLDGIPLDLTAYQDNYKGDIQPLLNLYKALRKPESITFVSEKNLRSYEAEIAKKIEAVFQQADTPEKVLAIRAAMEEETLLKKFYPSYKPRFRQKLINLGVSLEELDFFAEKKKLDRYRFKSWSEARKKMNDLAGDMNINSMAQMKLRSYIKYKVIHDLYGDNPTRSELENLRQTLYRQSWTSPEGDKAYFDYIADSENWFTGKIKRHNYVFQYTVTRDNPNSNKYELKILYVYQGRSNLAYKSSLTAEQLDDETFAIQIPLSRSKGYRWEESGADFFKAFYRLGSAEIDPLVMGSGLSAKRRSDHGRSGSALKAKVSPGDFSAKTAIRSALKYFILEYVGAMNI